MLKKVLDYFDDRSMQVDKVNIQATEFFLIDAKNDHISQKMRYQNSFYFILLNKFEIFFTFMS